MHRPLILAGIDEAGRGPLAGPVIAAVVILNPQKPIKNLADSKQLNAKQRAFLACQIKEQAMDWAIGRATVSEIDQCNILQATLLAMQRALSDLCIAPDSVLVDGLHCPASPYPIQAIVRGDQHVAAISAASILAKTHRDTEMLTWDSCYPGYGFAQHKGYGTAKHLQAIRELSITPIHRRSFSFQGNPFLPGQ
ncbi:MAG: ribonuclease HII [Candidatus Cardinium sp.]|nr:ribonuclease HII [Candidatus Cardinium sp.]